jgi:hypothetical protein
MSAPLSFIWLSAFNLPPGVLLTDLEDDLHFFTSYGLGPDEKYELELEKADEKHDEDL